MFVRVRVLLCLCAFGVRVRPCVCVRVRLSVSRVCVFAHVVGLAGGSFFFCESALRVPPAETRLTVYRRLEIARGRANGRFG